MYPTDNSYGLSSCSLLLYYKVFNTANATMCDTIDRLGFFNKRLPKQWTKALNSVWECYLFIPVTYPNVWLGLSKQNKEKYILKHDLKKKPGTVILTQHRRCTTVPNKASLPDVCQFMRSSYHGPLQHFVCNGREAGTRGRQTKGMSNRNGHFEQ